MSVDGEKHGHLPADDVVCAHRDDRFLTVIRRNHHRQIIIAYVRPGMVFAVQQHRHQQLAVHRLRADYHLLDADVLGLGTEFHPSHDTIPLSLMLLSNGDGIAIARHDERRHIILMGREARRLMPHLTAIDIDGGLSAAAFQKERYALLLPLKGDIDRLLIPRIASEASPTLLVGFQRPRQHHIVIIMRRVVERQIPGSLQTEEFLSRCSQD